MVLAVLILALTTFVMLVAAYRRYRQAVHTERLNRLRQQAINDHNDDTDWSA